MRESKPNLRDHRAAALVDVVFELGAESKELRQIVTSSRSELHARRAAVDRQFFRYIERDIRFREISRKN